MAMAIREGILRYVIVGLVQGYATGQRELGWGLVVIL